MYEKPTLERYGTLRELTLRGFGHHSEHGHFGHHFFGGLWTDETSNRS